MADETEPTTSEAPQAESVPTLAQNMIPRARLNEVIGERDTLRQRLEQLQAQVTTLEPFQQQVGALQAELGQVRALSRVGIIDDEGQAVAAMLYDRLTEKPEGGIGAWLSGFEDPLGAPRPLQPYLVKPSPAVAEAPVAAAPVAAAPRPDPNETAVAAKDGRLSAEALADAHARAMRGDKDAHDAIRRHMQISGYL